MLMVADALKQRGADPRQRVRRDGSPSAGGSKGITGLGHRRIADIQRARILSAMLDSASGPGAGSISVADVVERSGVSRRTFYELFVDRDDCFEAAFEQAFSEAHERVALAIGDQKRWQQRIRAGLVALLCFFEAKPQAGRALITGSLMGGPKVLARRGEVIAKLTSILEDGARESKTVLPSLTGEGVVGGVLAVIQRRLVDEDRDTPLVELTNPLMSMIALPYLGPVAARRELDGVTPTPSPETGDRSCPVDPFKDAGMRLTYRTVRVLTAIAECPGASNRAVADAAGVTDQGQISKLLGRLERAGMLTNTGLGPGTGAPNAWTLTPLGRQTTDGIGAHIEGNQSQGVH